MCPQAIKKPSQPHSDDDKKRVLKKALLNASARLALTRRELCGVIGMSEPTLSRLYSGKGLIDPDSKEGELALLLLRLYRSLDTLFGGNEKQCQLWFRSPNHHLNGTPAELVQSIQGFMTVVTYLDAMRGKI